MTKNITGLAKEILLRSPIVRRAIVASDIKKSTQKWEDLAKSKNIPKNRIITAKDYRLTIKNNHQARVAHIIGSGWSLNDSKNKIKENQNVFTCNFGGLWGGHINTWLIEFASLNSTQYQKNSLLQMQAINEVQKKQSFDLYIKNLWEHKIDAETIAMDCYQPALVLKEIYFPTSYLWKAGWEKQLVQEIMRDRDEILLQYMSTIVLLILSAKWSGAKEIVIHGLDGGGKYFFQEDYNILPAEIRQNFRENILVPEARSPHPSSGDIWPILTELNVAFLKMGINLYSGSSRSPSSEYIPTWEN